MVLVAQYIAPAVRGQQELDCALHLQCMVQIGLKVMRNWIVTAHLPHGMDRIVNCVCSTDRNRLVNDTYGMGLVEQDGACGAGLEQDGELHL
jgi:hypothetical protein